MKRILLLIITLLGSNFTKAQDSIPALLTSEDNKLLSVLWQQHAAEYRALCYQAFNFASLRLDRIKDNNKTHHYAIITDIDETILDNSYYEAQCIKDHSDFNLKTWKQWTDKAVATPVPGALEFLQKAKQKGITIFYISNRDTSDVKKTILNLRKFNLPNADAEHLMFMADKSSKEERRLAISKNHTVIMLLGDNLNDFTQLFEKKLSKDRKTEVDKVRESWGDRFIVLPNAIYGEWENAMYDYERKLTPAQKDEKLRQKLIGVPD